MIRILFLAMLLFVSVLLGLQVRQDPGYFLIAVNGWTIETTVWFAVICLITFFFVGHFLLLLLTSVVQLPSSYHQWIKKRRTERAHKKTSQGLIEFSQGNWSQAQTHLIEALPSTDTPLINYLTAASAAQRMGDNQLRDDYLREAQQSVPKARLAVELTQAQLQIASHQWEQAVATLKHLQILSPNHPYVLKLLAHLYQEVKDWPHLIELLPTIKRNSVLTEKEFLILQRQAYSQRLIDLIKQDKKDAIDAFIKTLPKKMTQETTFVAVYCRYLIDHQFTKQAEIILRASLKKQYDERLIALYGEISGRNSLEFAEAFIKTHPHSAALYLCLARLCAQQQLWGKAKNYLEHSIQLAPIPAAYIELGHLLERLDDPIRACEVYREGLEHTLKPGLFIK